jgi:hypothetical protein
LAEKEDPSFYNNERKFKFGRYH